MDEFDEFIDAIYDEELTRQQAKALFKFEMCKARLRELFPEPSLN